MADDLLDDLNDLGSDYEDDDDKIVVKPAGTSHFSSGAGTSSNAADDLEQDGSGSDDNSEDENGASASAESAEKEARDSELDAQLASLANRSGLRRVARLRETKRFQDHMKKTAEALAQSSIPPVVGSLEEWPEYRLILASNALVTALDDEQHEVFNYLTDLWKARFPELESIVPAMLDYAKVVKLIQNETDLTKLDFGKLLAPATVMVVTVTSTTTPGKPLAQDKLVESNAAADEVLGLEEAKQAILTFIESRMEHLAPNVSALLGTRVAAQLVGIAGGLSALSRTPSCNVQVLGQKKRHTAGFARTAAMPHAGVIFESPVVSSAPSNLKRKAAKVLAAKVVLAARVDSFQQSPGGDVGRELRTVVDGKLAKWQEPPPARQKKPLKAPDDRPAKRRGGKRYRAMKERLGMTDVRKEANRLSMTGGGEFDAVAMGTDTGMLGTGSSATGRLRVDKKVGQNAKLLGLAAKKRKLAVGQGGGVGGTLSSFAFTPVQGIELVNPEARKLKAGGVGGAASTIGGGGYATGYGASAGAGAGSSISGAGAGAASSVSSAIFHNPGAAAGGASYFDHSGTFTMIRPGK